MSPCFKMLIGNNKGKDLNESLWHDKVLIPIEVMGSKQSKKPKQGHSEYPP